MKCYYVHSASKHSCFGPCELSQGIGIMTQHSVAEMFTGTWGKYFLLLACLLACFLVSKNEGGHGQYEGSIISLMVPLPSGQSPPVSCSFVGQKGLTEDSKDSCALLDVSGLWV